MKESERETDEQSNRTKVQHYCSVVCRWWWYKNAYGHKSCFELLLNICVNGGAFYLKRFIVAKKKFGRNFSYRTLHTFWRLVNEPMHLIRSMANLIWHRGSMVIKLNLLCIQ